MIYITEPTISASFVHRQHLFWEKSPHHNYMWLCTVFILLSGHLVYTVHAVTITISHFEFALLCVTPFINLLVTELIKSKEIKINLRHQRRARLDFGTKLGMNSPF